MLVRNPVATGLELRDAVAYHWATASAVQRIKAARIAAAFASGSANTAVSTAEGYAETFAETGEYPIRRSQVLSAIDAITLVQCPVTLHADPPVSVLACWIGPGLGPAKAAFGLACLGVSGMACLDRHMLRECGLDTRAYTRTYERAQRGDKLGAAREYLALVRQAFPNGDAAVEQWWTFAERVPAFAQSGHIGVLRSILAALVRESDSV